MKNALKYTPDVKGPRFRKESEYTVTNEMARKIQKEVFASTSMKLSDIKKVIEEYNKEITNLVVTKRDGVEIPSQIGHLFVGTCSKPINKNVDYLKTKELKHVVQHRNWESDNHLAKIFFTTFASKYKKFKHNDLWSFEADRTFKRTVAKMYPENWKMYIQVDPYIKISSLFRNKLYNIERTEKDQEGLKTYNEFEF